MIARASGRPRAPVCFYAPALPVGKSRKEISRADAIETRRSQLFLIFLKLSLRRATGRLAQRSVGPGTCWRRRQQVACPESIFDFSLWARCAVSLRGKKTVRTENETFFGWWRRSGATAVMNNQPESRTQIFVKNKLRSPFTGGQLILSLTRPLPSLIWLC